MALALRASGAIVLVMSLIVFVALCFLTALSGMLFPPGDWFDGLKKPSFQPPKWAFPVAWTALYIMIAISGWLVWEAASPEQRPVPMAFFGIQLILNFLWSALFFGAKRMRLALVELVLLWLSIIAMIITFYPISPLAAWMLAPYLIWVSFAGVLNHSVWKLNPSAPN